MITVAVTYVFREGTLDEAERCMRALLAPVRAEPGCRSFSIYRSTERPRTYLFFEQYEDEPAVAAHRATPHFETFVIDGIRTFAESREAAAYEPVE